MSKRIRLKKLCSPSGTLLGYNYTPYKDTITLLESQHIYRKDDLQYNKTIETSVVSCLNDLTNSTNLSRIRSGEDIQYSKYSMGGIIPGINNVDLYIGYNAAYENAVNLSSTEEEEAEGLSHITQVNNGHIITAAIVMEVKHNTAKDVCIGIVKHELKHLLHKVNSEKMAETAGWAFVYAINLCEYHGIRGIPNFENLEDILEKLTKTKKGIIGIMGLAMYVLD